jgi:hypothetical protein
MERFGGKRTNWGAKDFMCVPTKKASCMCVIVINHDTKRWLWTKKAKEFSLKHVGGYGIRFFPFNTGMFHWITGDASIHPVAADATGVLWRSILYVQSTCWTNPMKVSVQFWHRLIDCQQFSSKKGDSTRIRLKMNRCEMLQNLAIYWVSPSTIDYYSVESSGKSVVRSSWSLLLYVPHRSIKVLPTPSVLQAKSNIASNAKAIKRKSTVA